MQQEKCVSSLLLSEVESEAGLSIHELICLLVTFAEAGTPTGCTPRTATPSGSGFGTTPGPTAFFQRLAKCLKTNGSLVGLAQLLGQFCQGR